MSTIINVIWLDENYDNQENIGYINELKEYHNLKIKCFKQIEEGINYIKNIEFEETNIIINGKLYGKFIEKFKEEINDIYIIPKIIIFAKDINEFMQNNYEYKNYINNSFYNLGGIKTMFNDIKDFILSPLNKKIMNREDECKLTFEYIDCEEKLYYPILYKALIDTTRTNNMDIFIDKIYNNYQNNSHQIKNLLNSIKNIQNIPIELLSKYYARLYTAESDNNSNKFYSDINKDLRENKRDNYLSYIKTLYEGIKTKSLPLGSNNILYRGSRLLNEEIEKIKEYLTYKKEGLPGAIVFSKAFLSFSKDRKIAENFLKNQQNNNILNKVLFILEKDENMDYSLSTHADIEKISFYPNEKEVLFFPFSSFEIKEININNENIYEIKLLYLGKYFKKLESKINNDNDNNIIIDNLNNDNSNNQNFNDNNNINNNFINNNHNFSNNIINNFNNISINNNNNQNFNNNNIINNFNPCSVLGEEFPKYSFIFYGGDFYFGELKGLLI